MTLADGDVRRYGWAVGCDGAHSAVRKLAGIGFPGVPLIERFLLADVLADLPVPAEAVSVWLRGDELLAAFPLPGRNRWRLMATAPESMTTGPAGPQLVSAVTHRLHAWTGWPETVVGPVDWTSTFSIHRRLADAYRVGRLLLAGDAAHIHSPFGGQGMNTGLGDAENLAWKLALVVRGRADAGLLDTYEAERLPVAAEVLTATSGLTRVILGDSPVSRLVRNRVFVPSLNKRVVQRLIADRASQLQVSYRHGPARSHRSAVAPSTRQPAGRPGAGPQLHPTGQGGGAPPYRTSPRLGIAAAVRRGHRRAGSTMVDRRHRVVGRGRCCGPELQRDPRHTARPARRAPRLARGLPAALHTWLSKTLCRTDRPPELWRGRWAGPRTEVFPQTTDGHRQLRSRRRRCLNNTSTTVSVGGQSRDHRIAGDREVD